MYLPGFYHFPVLTLILPFSETRPISFSIVARILSFLGTCPDSTIFRYSHWIYPFSKLVQTVFQYWHGSTFSPYAPGLYHFQVLALILPFSDTRPESFSLLARIVHFPDIRPDSTIVWYSQWCYPFPILVRTVFRYSHGFYLFSVLAQIVPISGTHTDSTLFRNSSGQFFNSGTDSTFSRNSPELYHFPVLTWFYLFPKLARTVFQ